MTANIRVDNVGVKKDPITHKITLDFKEAKYSINNITVNNIKQTLTAQQQKGAEILINGTDIQISIRGKGSAEKINTIVKGPTNVVNNKGDVTGMIDEIKIVVPSNNSAGGTQTSQTTTSSTTTNTNGTKFNQ
jgi:hypothetical protein